MAVSLQQTDTTSVDAVASFCSGLGLATSSAGRTATSGGTAGTGTPACTIQASGNNKIFFLFETASGECNSYTCPAGNWTVPVNISTGFNSGASCTITQIWICRVNSSGVSQETIGSLTGQSTDITTSGVKTFVVSGNAVTFNTGDRVTILIAGSNGDVVAATGNVKPNQAITTPMTTGGASGGGALPRVSTPPVLETWMSAKLL